MMDDDNRERDEQCRGGRRTRSRKARSGIPAEQTLAKIRVERAQLEQARVFQGFLVDEAQQLQQGMRRMHDELCDVYRQLAGLQRRFSVLPPPVIEGQRPMIGQPKPTLVPSVSAFAPPRRATA